MKTKVLYLHGLESQNTGPKIDYLIKRFGLKNVYAPKMEYRKKNLFINKIYDFRDFLNGDNNWIIGSSMGGYFGFYYQQLFDCKTILFNPAINKHEPLAIFRLTTNKNNIVFSDNDDVILGGKVVEFLDVNKIEYNKINIESGHRISEENFISVVDALIDSTLDVQS